MLHYIYLQEKSNGSSQGGPRQRAEALAALNSAFKSSPEAAASAVHQLVFYDSLYVFLYFCFQRT